MPDMKSESRLRPILGHLAWLADRIADPINKERLKDATLLTYNAVAMLQLRFVAPLSRADVVLLESDRKQAAEAIDRLVRFAEKAVKKVSVSKGDYGIPLRDQLVAEVRKLLRKLPRLMRIADPIPARMPELEASPNLRELLDELLAKHAKTYAVAIAKGRHSGAKGGVGPYKAINEAIAELIYVYDDARDADMSPELRRSLTQMATGFFKTAVEIQPKDFPPALRKRLTQRANALITRTTPSNP